MRRLTRRPRAGRRSAPTAAGEQGLAELRQRHADLVLLDVMLPDLDGFEVLRRIRATSQVGVIVLTARAEEVDTLVGLAVGADDDVTKPFSPRAVVARVKAVLRRARADEGDSERLEFDGLTVDLAAREVRLGTGSVAPPALEFDLLAARAGAPGRVFSRRQLLERVRGDDFYGDERVVDVHIRSLRRLLADDVAAPRYIGTVRGVGYKFVRRPAWPPGGLRVTVGAPGVRRRHTPMPRSLAVPYVGITPTSTSGAHPWPICSTP